MFKKKTVEKESDSPRNFEIIPQISSVKLIRERDNRVQAASSLSVLLSVGLLVSVAALVYQAFNYGGYNYYAQELITGAFTELQPIPDEKKLTKYKMASVPSYNEKEDLVRLEERMKHRAWLAGLLDPETQQARAAAEAAAAAQVAAQPASAASAAAQAPESTSPYASAPAAPVAAASAQPAAAAR